MRQVFFDPFHLSIHEPDHSESEDRWLTMGMVEGAIVVVIHTFRTKDNVEFAIKTIGKKGYTKKDGTVVEDIEEVKYSDAEIEKMLVQNELISTYKAVLNSPLTYDAMMRSIDGTVPEHYMPQLQLCMDILDLEEADFIQYKPEDLTWPKPSEFVVTNVKRDREWFAKYMPVMRDFWDKVVYHREHGIEDPPPKKTRKKKEIIRPECPIVTDSDEDYYDEY